MVSKHLIACYSKGNHRYSQWILMDWFHLLNYVSICHSYRYKLKWNTM
jgi:hypothetical protein